MFTVVGTVAKLICQRITRPFSGESSITGQRKQLAGLCCSRPFIVERQRRIASKKSSKEGSAHYSSASLRVSRKVRFELNKKDEGRPVRRADINAQIRRHKAHNERIPRGSGSK
jgi:hypothetical protein